MVQVAETYTAHHHKDKAATLHVVPEYEDNDDTPSLASGTNNSDSTLPIPRARQAFIPRGSSNGDPPMSVSSQQTHLQLPSPTATSALYGALPKWGGRKRAFDCCAAWNCAKEITPIMITPLTGASLWVQLSMAEDCATSSKALCLHMSECTCPNSLELKQVHAGMQGSFCPTLGTQQGWRPAPATQMGCIAAAA